ncbi:MAG: hypothetical protein K2H68_00280 [Bacteroidales bacterium]|nr:hypothetical protein [Bacteroidales bacterium]
MKKLLLLTIALFLFCSCEPEGKPEGNDNKNKKSMLWNASCKVNIQTGNNQKKNVEVVGDSVAVHRLCVYADEMGGLLNKDLWHLQVDTFWHTRDSWTFNMASLERDTINHIFTFWNSFVIQFHDYYIENGEQMGLEGSEYLGLLASYDLPLFRAIYDTVKHEYKDLEEKGWPGWEGYPNLVWDTLGYIPFSLMEKNRNILLQMLEEKRYQDMLDFFKSGAYVIYTCTGEEYRKARQELD